MEFGGKERARTLDMLIQHFIPRVDATQYFNTNKAVNNTITTNRV